MLRLKPEDLKTNVHDEEETCSFEDKTTLPSIPAQVERGAYHFYIPSQNRMQLKLFDTL